jgi:hypothetical protein
VESVLLTALRWDRRFTPNRGGLMTEGGIGGGTTAPDLWKRHYKLTSRQETDTDYATSLCDTLKLPNTLLYLCQHTYIFISLTAQVSFWPICI